MQIERERNLRKNSNSLKDEYRFVQGMLKELEERGCIKKDDLNYKRVR